MSSKARLTARGLHIASAITMSVYAHVQQTLVWYHPPSGSAAYHHIPGELPTITMTAGELKHSEDPILLHHKSEPGPRWFGSYSRGWWHVEGAVIDFSTANFGAHVVWLEEYLPAPHYICGGPQDVNFDGVEDERDFLDFMVWLGQEDERADWNEDGVYDIFDLLEYMTP